MPTVSVIVPVYGVEKYVERCANSLFSQTLEDMEFIFIDDCTKDNSILIIKQTLELYPKRKGQVSFYKMPHNSGLPTVRKYGISIAKGQYIAHCDSDDWIDVCMYEKMYIYALKNDFDIVYCDYYKSNGIKHQYVKQCETNRFMLGPVWNKLVKASLYRNDIHYPRENKAEDGALMMQLSFYAKSRGHISEALYYYFNNQESICRVPSKEACLERHRQECKNLELRLAFLQEKGVENLFRDEIVSWKLVTRKNLLPLVGNKEYLKMWRESFPEINKKVLWCRKVHFKSKLLFIAVYLNIYPFIPLKHI